jgi:hypothetical protein
VHQRFRLLLCNNTLGELIQLQRETIVAGYQSKFLALVTRCAGLIEKHQIDIFTNGLCNPLKTNIELEAPVTLEDTMALARTYDQCLQMGTEQPSRVNHHSSSERIVPASKPLALPTPPAATASPSPCLKCLTLEKMVAKRKRGECYNCTEKFSREHLKVCPMKGIYLLQMDESQAADTETKEDPLISLNAITGLSSADTM